MSALLVTALPLVAQTQGQPPISAQRRAGPPTGPVPRLPDGTVDLTGAWVGGGPINDLEGEGGLKPGELDTPLLPSAKQLMAARDLTMEPHNQCMPMSLSRTTPFPYRFVQTPTHKAATHSSFCRRATSTATGRCSWTAENTRRSSTRRGMGTRSAGGKKDTLVIDTRLQRQVLVRSPRPPHTERLHTIERWTRKDPGTWKTRSRSTTRGVPSVYLDIHGYVSPPGDELLEYACPRKTINTACRPFRVRRQHRRDQNGINARAGTCQPRNSRSRSRVRTAAARSSAAAASTHPAWRGNIGS